MNTWLSSVEKTVKVECSVRHWCMKTMLDLEVRVHSSSESSREGTGFYTMLCGQGMSLGNHNLFAETIGCCQIKTSLKY